MTWALVEQDEGLMVEVTTSEDVTYFFVDYHEAKNNKQYAEEKLEEITTWGECFPQHHVNAIINTLKEYINE